MRCWSGRIQFRTGPCMHRDKMIADAMGKRAEAELKRSGTRQRQALLMASLVISKNMAPAARSQVERMTGIEPALSAGEFADPVRLMHSEQPFMCWLSIRGRPLITASNGPPMARRCPPKSGCNTRGHRGHPSPARVPASRLRFPARKVFRDTGDSGDTF
jgi:hypothetical protein